MVIASEAGVVDWPAKDIVAKGRLGPGEMLAVDLHRGELLDTHRIDQINAARAPFKRWLKQGVKYLQTDLIDPRLAAEPMPQEELLAHQKMFNLTAEERDSVLKVLAETEAEAIGSMGDDTPLPLLSSRVRSLYDAFRQAFAQVTNPPIDSYRERLVMSLHTQIARESNLFELNHLCPTGDGQLAGAVAAQVPADSGHARRGRRLGHHRSQLPRIRRLGSRAGTRLSRGRGRRAGWPPAGGVE